MKLIFLIVLLTALPISAQEVEEIYISDFSGGLVNSISNSLMSDNQATIMTNFTVTDVGSLERRPGLLRWRVGTDSLTGRQVYSIAPYYNAITGSRRIIAHRSQGGSGLSQYSSLYSSLWAGTRDTVRSDSLSPDASSAPKGMTSAYWLDKGFYATEGNVLTWFDGKWTRPACPEAPGQPRLTVFDSVGMLSGAVQYAYYYRDHDGDKTSGWSAYSWIAKVTKGAVLLSQLSPPLDVQTDSIVIVARYANSDYWTVRGQLAASSRSFLDSLPLPLGTVTHLPMESCWDGMQACDTLFLKSPGTCNYTVLGFSYADSGVNNYPCYLAGGITDTTDLTKYPCNRVAYRFFYIDSAGAYSPLSGVLCVPVADRQRGRKVQFDSLPSPGNSWGGDASRGIKYVGVVRYEVKSVFGETYGYDDPSGRTPSMSPPLDYYCGPHDSISIYTNEDIGWMVGLALNNSYPVYYEDSIGIPRSYAFLSVAFDRDSTIQFMPSSIAYFGNRLWAIGDAAHPNYVWYSLPGRFNIWPSSKFVSLQAQSGDYLVGVAPLSDRLVLFYQNSFGVLDGLNTFQMSWSLVDNVVGLTAPRGLATDGHTVYFPHSSGIWAYGQQTGLTQSPITLGIKSSFDSIPRIDAISGGLLKKDYWFSGNGTTYFMKSQPRPHWEACSFNARDVVSFEPDTSKTYDEGEEALVLLENDTIYRYGQDSTDESFIATWQSKFFLEGGGRKKVFWVDIEGTGTATLTVSVVKDYKKQDVVTSQTRTVNLSDPNRSRFIINEIVESAAVRIVDSGTGGYSIKGVRIGWKPWDVGKL